MVVCVCVKVVVSIGSPEEGSEMVAELSVHSLVSQNSAVFVLGPDSLPPTA